jgi:hypothetical protein
VSHAPEISLPISSQKGASRAHAPAISPPISDQKGASHASVISPPTSNQKGASHGPTISAPTSNPKDESGSLVISPPIFNRNDASSNSENLSPHDISGEKRNLLFDLAIEVKGQCPICFFHRIQCRPHWAYRCDSGLCGNATRWKTFKAALRLGSSVCWRCAFPFDPPCDHPRGSNQCEFPDLLKELAFLVYVDSTQIRDAVFFKLGVSCPSTIGQYAIWLGRTSSVPGSVVNIVEVLAAYWALRKDGLLAGF